MPNGEDKFPTGIVIGAVAIGALGAGAVYLYKNPSAIDKIKNIFAAKEPTKMIFCDKEGKLIPLAQYTEARCSKTYVPPSGGGGGSGGGTGGTGGTGGAGGGGFTPAPAFKGIFKGQVIQDSVTPLADVAIKIWDVDKFKEAYAKGGTYDTIPFDYQGKTGPDGTFSFELPYDPTKTYKLYEAIFYKECHSSWEVPISINSTNKWIFVKNLTMPLDIKALKINLPAWEPGFGMNGTFQQALEGGAMGKGVYLKDVVLNVDEVYEHGMALGRKVYFDVYGKDGSVGSLWGIDYGSGGAINTTGSGAPNVDKPGRKVVDLTGYKDKLVIGVGMRSLPVYTTASPNALFTKGSIEVKYCKPL